jgi:hypothetical protein
MKKISAHISYGEATKSQTATRKGIDNTPSEFQLANMHMVATMCFEPLRKWHGKPIGISSFMRSKELNEDIGGSTTSQHMQGFYTKVQEGAIDIDADIYENGISNLDIFNWLVANVDFDQIILEYPNELGEAKWIHISYRKGANRKMKLRADRVKGKTKYTVL